jgi:hypothetical protein
MKDDYNFDPMLAEKAKKLASGPLGKEMAKFPLRFAVSVFFGQKPNTSFVPKISNGTATLVDFGHGPIAITCHHVLDAYRKKLSENNQIIFQIGNLKINPLNKIIDEHKELDLATINLNGENIRGIGDGSDIASHFYHPVSWPPQSIKQGDFVAFGGFPGRWRVQPSTSEIIFDSFSSGACPVASVREDVITCQFEREYWVYSFNLRPDEDLRELGGLSGAPVFILKKIHYELIGIVYEFSSFDLMFIRPAKYIREDGIIIKDV